MDNICTISYEGRRTEIEFNYFVEDDSELAVNLAAAGFKIELYRWREASSQAIVKLGRLWWHGDKITPMAVMEIVGINTRFKDRD